jgi:hypothetical protein
MASTVLTGSYCVFEYSSQLNGEQIDSVKGGAVPTSSSAGSYTRLFTSAEDGMTISRESEVLDLLTQEEGLKSSVITGSEVWTITVPIANIDVDTYRDLLQLNPSTAYYGTTEAVVPLEGDYQGTDLLENGMPLLIYHKSYHTGDRDVPVVGTGGDPNSWFFNKAGLADRNMEVTFDPNSQQIQNVVFKAASVDGTSETSVVGVYGALTPQAT